MKYFDLSVLICTHNSQRCIKRALDCLKKQKKISDIKWEIIIVDYDSSDGTLEILKNFHIESQVPIKIINEPTPGKSPALKAGLDIARGVAICIVDDDNLVNEHYLYTANKIIKQHQEVGLIGAYGAPIFDGISRPEWFFEYQGVYAVGHQANSTGYVLSEKRNWFWGAGSVIRKEAWLKLRALGFSAIMNPSRDSSLHEFKVGFFGGEDQELSYAIQIAGFNLWYESSLKYGHLIPQERLNENYLLKTASGVSQAAPILRLYSFFSIKKQGFFRYFFYQIHLRYWIGHFIIVVLKIPYRILRVLAGSSKYKKLELQRIVRICKAEIIGLLTIKKTYAKILHSVRMLSVKDE
jgi:glycosyltransferase involved in cell wall biosynthesis